jgi:hypothetical protein
LPPCALTRRLAHQLRDKKCLIQQTPSQVSDVGSIPIARSITPDDSIAFLPGSC